MKISLYKFSMRAPCYFFSVYFLGNLRVLPLVDGSDSRFGGRSTGDTRDTVRVPTYQNVGEVGRFRKKDK